MSEPERDDYLNESVSERGQQRIIAKWLASPEAERRLRDALLAADDADPGALAAIAYDDTAVYPAAAAILRELRKP